MSSNLPIDISDIHVQDLTKSMFIEPLELHYTLRGHRRKWDFVNCDGSVQIVIYNKSTDKLLFVKQFRPAVYMSYVPRSEMKGKIDIDKYPLDKGFTLEFCAGLIDKEKNIKEIAKEEILEECGYDVPLSELEEVTVCKIGTGVLAQDVHYFFTDVKEEMKTHSGGGLKEEGEYIEVVEKTVEEAQDLLSDPSYSIELKFGLQWFFRHKCKSNTSVNL